jgi:hypothetical protein
LSQVIVPPGSRIQTDQVINDLMGKDPRARFLAITENLALVGALDV